MLKKNCENVEVDKKSAYVIYEWPLANPNLETVGPLRLITQGQEINCETDEKNLAEMSFKDLQLVFVSQGNLYSLINMRQLQILFN